MSDRTRPVLHVGFPKTGTTWLQKRFFKEHPEIRYFDRHKESGAWLFDVVSEPEAFWDESAFFERTRTFARSDGALLNVASYEHLSGTPFTGSLERGAVARRLKQAFPDARIVIGLRSQPALLWSVYVQYVMLGGTLRGGDFFAMKWPAATFVDLRAFEFDRFVGLYRDLFGVGDVFIYFQEDMVTDLEGILRDFCGWLGIGPFFARDSREPVNATLGNPLFTVLRLANHFLFSPINPSHLIPRSWADTLALRKILQRKLDPRLRRLGLSSPPRPSAVWARMMKERFADSNARLEEMLGRLPASWK